jgi:hypothetical protein
MRLRRKVQASIVVVPTENRSHGLVACYVSEKEVGPANQIGHSVPAGRHGSLCIKHVNTVTTPHQLANDVLSDESTTTRDKNLHP